MNLYVWTDVLTDYSSGMVVALAPDMDTALKMAREKDEFVARDMGQYAPVAVIPVLAEPQAYLWFAKGGG